MRMTKDELRAMPCVTVEEIVRFRTKVFDHIAELEQSGQCLDLDQYDSNDRWVRRCQDYMAFVRSDEFHPDKMDSYENAIFEAAMIQVFGVGIFDEINSRMD